MSTFVVPAIGWGVLMAVAAAAGPSSAPWWAMAGLFVGTITRAIYEVTRS